LSCAKVFGIGFHKTGTTSLAAALRQLGYSVTGPNFIRCPSLDRDVLRLAFAVAEQFDAFQDNPWPVIFRELDERFPGSKFILTLRSSESWIASQVRHFGRQETPMRKWIYGVGCPIGNEATYIERFERHNADVKAHFRERDRDLLVMEFSKGDGWAKLCPFLGKDVPTIPFPHLNQARERT